MKIRNLTQKEWLGLLILLLVALFYVFRFIEHPDQIKSEFHKILFFFVVGLLIFGINSIPITTGIFRNRRLFYFLLVSLPFTLLFVVTGIWLIPDEPGSHIIWFSLNLAVVIFYAQYYYRQHKKEQKFIQSTPWAGEESGGITCRAGLMSTDDEKLIEVRVLLLNERLVFIMSDRLHREFELRDLDSIRITYKYVLLRRVLIKTKGGERFHLIVPFPNFWKKHLTKTKPS
jgi:hypothetical protein